MMAAGIPSDQVLAAKDFEILKLPECILLFSGKRKSGKDHLTDKLYERIGPDRSKIVKLSGPIKSYWAKHHNLDIKALLGNGEYKENYRLEMIKWSEGIRQSDYGFFCRGAIEMFNVWKSPIWIVSDVRRKTDIQWFRETFGDLCKTIRIVSSEEVRQKRGWVFTAGIDDSETECNLDDIEKWDLCIPNDDDNVETQLQRIMELIK